MLRPLGDIERLCAIRHFQGSYRCVAVTATYSASSTTRDVHRFVESALAKVISKHPILCVGIVHEETNGPAFVQLESIEISSCIEYQDVIAITVSEYDAALEEILERQHSQLWPELHCQPPWKIIVVQSKPFSSPKFTMDIIFAYHHSLADGISGLIFHQSLLEAFNTNSMVESHVDQTIIPKGLVLSVPIEKQCKFKVSIRELLRAVWANSAPTWMKEFGRVSFWTANPCTLDQLRLYTSRSRIISLDASHLAAVIAACRRQNATLTGLLHGIIVASLATRVPEARKFKAGTAYSLRHLTEEPSRKEMGAYAFGYSLPYSTRTVSKIRASKTDWQLTNQIWDTARSFSASVKSELSQLPKGHYIALIPWAKDLHGTMSSGYGKPRPETFEISNIGSFKPETGRREWNIDKMVLSQSGGAGPAISFNVVSVTGGPLTVCATWLQGGVEETLVNLLCEDIVLDLKRLGR